MQFNRRKKKSSLPEVNLIPTIDVVMCVLTFFLILTMTLRGQHSTNLDLPTTGETSNGNNENNENIATENLILSLTREGELFWRDRPLTVAEMEETVQMFLTEHPEGEIVLEADRQLPYQNITRVLQQISEIGGDRVSLALQN